MTETEILNDINRRHSTLHAIDSACVQALTAITTSIPAAGEHGLLPEHDAVYAALCALHAAAKAKWEALP